MIPWDCYQIYAKMRTQETLKYRPRDNKDNICLMTMHVLAILTLQSTPSLIMPSSVLADCLSTFLYCMHPHTHQVFSSDFSICCRKYFEIRRPRLHRQSGWCCPPTYMWRANKQNCRSIKARMPQETLVFLLYMYCTRCWFRQPADCPAQSVDSEQSTWQIVDLYSFLIHKLWIDRVYNPS